MNEHTGERIGRILDAIGWPTADRDLSPGQTVCGQWAPDGATALDQIRNLADTEQGLFYIAGDGKATFRDRNWQMTAAHAITARATFGDSGSEIKYRDITIQGNDLEHIRNVVTVTYPDASVTVKDATSIGQYGAQTDSVTATDLQPWAGNQARQLGNYRLRARKDPLTRVPSLVVDPRAGTLSATLPAVIDLELGDRVNAKRRPTGGTGTFSQDCSVQGIDHDVTPATWRTNLYLAPAPKSYTEAPYLVVGDATYGKIGATAGNVIPY
jgi:hypothetical protein